MLPAFSHEIRVNAVAECVPRDSVSLVKLIFQDEVEAIFGDVSAEMVELVEDHRFADSGHLLANLEVVEELAGSGQKPVQHEQVVHRKRDEWKSRKDRLNLRKLLAERREREKDSIVKPMGRTTRKTLSLILPTSTYAPASRR